MENQETASQAEPAQAELLGALGIVLGQREGDIGAALRQLDAATGRYTGHLHHFLSKRSYQKAWDYLQGQADAAQAGSDHAH